MPAVDSLMNPQVVPEHRPLETPDIIDVDSLDADDVVYVGSARPRRIEGDERAAILTGDVIDVTDSEDDNDIQFIGHNPARPQPPLVRRGRIFSPPPPPQIGAIPPVPQIPQRFLRPRPPPGLVIPNEDPFPFEANLRQAPPVDQPFPAAAPSHHVPSMGFGGALLAGVRRIMGPGNTSQRHEHHNGWGSFIMQWDPFDFAGGEEDYLDGLGEIGLLDEDNNPFAGRVRSQIERAFKQRGRDSQAQPDYMPEYTHPDQPLPGFTHDFSPSTSSSPVTEADSDATYRASGSGTRLCEATLVCAACRDPLILGASDIGEGRARRKLWGLRCGHLLDGKCIEKLMEPTPPTPDATGSNSGRSASMEPASSSQDTASDAGSMRSRLRPRRGMPGSARHLATGSSLGGRRGRAQPAHRNNRKGKGKMKAPVVEAEHEWNCPVGGCGRVHQSLQIDGRWTMDEKRGAIAVFV